MAHPSRVVTAIVSLGIASSLALSGCSLLPSTLGVSGPNQTDGATSDGTGPDGSGPDGSVVDGTDTDSSTIDDLGNDPSLNHEIPVGFPSEIPLPTLELVYSLDLGTGWSLVFKSSDPVADFAGIDAAFSAGGWSTLQTSTNGDTAFGAYQNDTYQVQVSGAGSDAGFDTPVVTYTVVRLG
jgi:hypothetical protein